MVDNTLGYARMMGKVAIGLLASLYISAAAADVYRWVDENGNVVFSDRPQPGAEQIEVAPVQTVTLPALPAAAPADRRQNPALSSYTRVAISQPGNDQTLRDNLGNINVAVSLEPDLQARHQVQLFVDGAPWGEPGAQTEFALQNLDRGTHQLRAAVIDRTDGRVVTQSDVVTFHLHRESVLNRPPAATGGP